MSSTAESLLELPADELAAFLRETPNEQKAVKLFNWEFWARPEQLPPAGDWRIWLVLSGRGFGKTRIGAEWVRAQVQEFQFVNLIGPTAADVRDIMVDGESGIMASCPPWERPEYLPSRRLLKWPNGARSLLFSAEDPESLRGPQHQRLWCDEIAAWSGHTREETWTLATLGLRLPPDPRALLTTTPKPVPLLRELVEDENVIITKGTTYDNAENLAPAFLEQIIKRYEGTRLGRQELDAELLLDEGLAYRLQQGVHVIPPFDVPPHWTRFEGLDHGLTHETAWLSFASDEDGNLYCHDAYYSPGLVSEHAVAIKAKRKMAGEGSLFADPSIKARTGTRDWRGREVTIELEYADHGIASMPGQNDRRAGYARISELLRLDVERYFPLHHPMYGQTGAPTLYILDRPELEPLVQQLRDAPLEDPTSPLSMFPGEAVEKEWEGRRGHAHAAARYALMSRPSPSAPVPFVPDDPRAALLQRVERQRDEQAVSSRYEFT